MKQGKTNSRRPHSPTQTEGLHTVWCGLLTQGVYNGTKNYFQDPWVIHNNLNIK